MGNRAEEDSRTLEMRIEVSNPNGRLMPGTVADMEIITTGQQER